MAWQRVGWLGLLVAGLLAFWALLAGPDVLAGVELVEIYEGYSELLFIHQAPGTLHSLTGNTVTTLADKDVARRIEEQGAVVDTSTPEQLALTVRQEIAKWKGVVHKAQLTPD